MCYWLTKLSWSITKSPTLLNAIQISLEGFIPIYQSTGVGPRKEMEPKLYIKLVSDLKEGGEGGGDVLGKNMPSNFFEQLYHSPYFLLPRTIFWM